MDKRKLLALVTIIGVYMVGPFAGIALFVKVISSITNPYVAMAFFMSIFLGACFYGMYKTIPDETVDKTLKKFWNK
jgi:hypothetical protein